MRKVLFSVVVVLIWICTESLDTENEELPETYSDESLELSKNVTCGQNRTTKSGDFHLAIGNLTGGVCYWMLNPNGTNVTMFIHKLFLHEDDLLTLYGNWTDAHSSSSQLLNEPIRAQNGSVTVITEEKMVILKLEGNDTTFIRKFEGMYQSQGCNFPISPDLQILHSPIHGNLSTDGECQYTYNKDPHKRATPVFFLKSSTIPILLALKEVFSLNSKLMILQLIFSLIQTSERCN